MLFNNWIRYGFVGVVFASVYTLLIKELSASIPAEVFLFYVTTGQLIFFYFIHRNEINKQKYSKNILAFGFVLATLSYLGNHFEIEAVKLAPNLGYVAAVKLGQIVIVTLLGDFITGHKALNSRRLLSVLTICIGLFLISSQKSLVQNETSNIDWLWYSLAAMVSFAFMLLGMRKLVDTISQSIVLIIIVSISSFFYLIDTEFHQHSLRLDFSTFVWLLASSMSAGLFNLYYTKALSSAPNPGFAVAVNGAQVLLISLLSLIFFKDQDFSVSAGIGIIFALSGIIGLVSSTLVVNKS